MAHDEGHRLTDKRLAALEKRIARLYREASEELQREVEAYFAAFASRDARQKALLEEGKITPEHYKQWRLNQIGRGRRFEALRDRLAQRYTQANEVAVAYVNDETPGIYTLNRNYAAYTIEQAGGDVDFTLWDEQTVKRLVAEDPGLMPYYPPERAVKRGIDLAYGKQVITRQVTGGILQGESIGKIADRLQANLPAMERASALRAARTAVTGAQNAGRMESYAAAEKMGTKLQREWIATLDNRTRHSHAMVDGERRALGESFSNGCRFPGDPQGPANEVYNCRCTLAAVVAGVDTSGGQRRARDPATGESVLIPDMTYAQWEAWKKSENGAAWETYRKKGRNASADHRQYEKYRKILKGKAGKTFDEFQSFKYNDTERWAFMKLDYARRNNLLNHPETALPNADRASAPSEKFTAYLFNPENKDGWAKGRAFSSRLGYAKENWKALQKEILRGASAYPASHKGNNGHGERYEQRMVLYGKNGTPANVIVGWIKREDGSVSMTSAYIKEVE